MKPIVLILIALSAVSCSQDRHITVSNTSDIERRGELVELELSEVRPMVGDGMFVLRDQAGEEIPYQITHDSLLVFPVSVAAKSTATYTIASGTPSASDTIACGAFYERRKDDLAWENDRSAYRAYGPALQASGERSFGYDVWTKSVSHPVVAKRYSDAFANIHSFHEDNGNGMDVYVVGPTLGCGTAALLDADGNIIYPWGFESYEILDNGPLRFTVRLIYPETEFDGCKVRETRLISIDSGDYLNRTVVSYDGLSRPATMAPGIVIHRHNPDGYVLDNENSLMACADLTDNPDAGNGVIYLGVVAPQADTLVAKTMPAPEGDAIGHILAKSKYLPGSSYVYYWGSGWSKGSMPDWNSWLEYLKAFRTRLSHPLAVSID